MADIISRIFGAVSNTAAAEATAVAMSYYLGTKPTVTTYPDYAEITLSPAQEAAAADFLIRQLKKEPGPVRINLGTVFVQVLFRQYWLYILGVFGGGVALGRATKGGK